jgi:DNA-directed RNA polymerase specialized sigma24 family protein
MGGIHGEGVAIEEQLSGIRPLTRIVGERVYCRSAEVEAQIASALMLDRAELCQRAQQHRHTQPEYLSPECLVYLIREFMGRGDEEMVSTLCECLIRRSNTQIYKHLGTLDAESVEESYREVMTELFSRILDLESDRGDFLQVRYWVAVKRLAISAYRKRVRLLEQGRKTDPLSTLPGEKEPGDSEDGRTQRATRVPWIDDALSADDRLLIAEALSQLSGPVQEAFFLAHVEELPIESKDPTTMTHMCLLKRPSTGIAILRHLTARSSSVLLPRQRVHDRQPMRGDS